MLSRLMTPREQLVIGFIGIAAVIGSLTALWMNRAAVAPPPVPEPPVVPAVVEASLPVVDPTPAAAVAVLPVSEGEPLPAEIVVSVRGAVQRPGVYYMKSTDRVHDLIGEAGGLLESASINDINLAAKLIDATTLTIPGDPKPQLQDGVATLRRRGAESAVNPPQYTLSGWLETSSTPATFGAASDSTQPEARFTASDPASNDRGIDLNMASADQLEQLPGIGPVLAQAIISHRTIAPFESVEQLQNVRGIGPKRYESLRDLVTVRP